MPASLWPWSWGHGPSESRCKPPWLDPYKHHGFGAWCGLCQVLQAWKLLHVQNLYLCDAVLPNVLLCHGSSRFLTVHSGMRWKEVQRPESRFGLRAWQVLGQPCKPSSVSSPSCKDSHGSSVVQCHLVKFPQNFMLKETVNDKLLCTAVRWGEHCSVSHFSFCISCHEAQFSGPVFLSQDIFPTLMLLFFFAFNYSSISVSFRISS